MPLRVVHVRSKHRPELPLRRTLGEVAAVALPVDRFARHDERGEHTVLVVDVDLRNTTHVRIVKAGLARNEALPAVFAVERGSHADEIQAMALGADRLVTRPIEPLALEQAIRVLLPDAVADDGAGDLADEAPGVPPAIRAGTASAAAVFARFRNGRPPSPAALDGWSGAIDEEIDAVGIDRWLATARNHHGGAMQHTMLVAGLASRFGADLGLPVPERRLLTAAALVHDIGAARIPQELFEKGDRLTEAEAAIVRKHPTVGAAFLADSGLDARIVAAVRQHHEYLDGSGYPDRLRGAEISSLSRIVGLCDVFAGLVGQHSYRLPMPAEAACRQLEQMAEAGKLDPTLVRAFQRTARSVVTTQVAASMERAMVGQPGVRAG